LGLSGWRRRALDGFVGRTGPPSRTNTATRMAMDADFTHSSRATHPNRDDQGGVRAEKEPEEAERIARGEPLPPLAEPFRFPLQIMPYKDPEKQREADRRWREANPEKVREANRRWREANPEKQREATRRWHEANPEYGRKQSRRWREANLEKARAREAAYRAANRETRRAYMAAYKASRKDATRLYAREATFGPDPRRPRPMAQDEWSPDC